LNASQKADITDYSPNYDCIKEVLLSLDTHYKIVSPVFCKRERDGQNESERESKRRGRKGEALEAEGLKQTVESGKFALPIPTRPYLINTPLK